MPFYGASKSHLKRLTKLRSQAHELHLYVLSFVLFKEDIKKTPDTSTEIDTEEE